jgi:hypothetical protein
MSNEETAKDTTKTAAKKNNGAPGTPPVNPTPAAALTPPVETQAIEVFDYGEDAGQGYELQTMADRKLPIFELLQSNSPEVVESRGKVYAGQWRNSVTGEIFDEILLVAAVTDNAWTEWIPRDDGGGFRGRHPINAKIVKDAIARNDGRAIGKLPVPQPNDPKTGKPQPTHELVEGFEIYAIQYDKSGEVLGFGMIPFTSTKIKVYRAWNSALAGFAPTINGKKLAPGQVPIFAHRVKMTSAVETKNGNTYMIPVLSPAEGGDDLKLSLLPKTDARYIAAKKLHDDVLNGLAKAAYETTKQEPGADPESGVPF